ncbi:C-terminal processing protease CtpA/Prc [Chryseobacterium ginsenosidimutans]|uniref:S41 family peptidase n=1 Tax=Chryseobacterium ginsenosidimutans TaxID=687846 RepID=UPI002169150E|nr:S41 family peptidase [Chryseobacterium ginsenosidimutans]MCS3870273.1 C-terminal processing protease CtpA/Prc [Chryseobacterium ginsenosidimutans]
MKNFLKIQRVILVVLSMLISCNRTDDDAPDFPEGSTESVNLWVQDSMRRYYYWADQMPLKPDYHLPVKDFFKSLLASQDRFSFIVNTADSSTYPLSVRNMYGFDYAILQLSNGEVVTVIKLVLKNSPASNAGLERGMMITKINGQTITASNAEQLTSSIPTKTILELTVGKWENGSIINEKNITVYYGYSLDQPLVSKIFEKNGKKTGYLYVYDFPDGMTPSLNQKFAEFKSLGVQELVLDLRYNYGGSVSSAAALCSLIPSGISADSQFIVYKGNKNGGEVKRTFAQQIAYDPGSLGFTALHTNSLGLNKVYILTSKSTASASEIVINNLKPYVQVIQVGDLTLGKDMAGFMIEDKRKPKKITWQIHPVVYKVFNANGEGNYSNGIAPQLAVNEFVTLPLRSLGDADEVLLSSVLSKIYSKSVNKEIDQENVKILFQSETSEAGFSRVKFK